MVDEILDYFAAFLDYGSMGNFYIDDEQAAAAAVVVVAAVQGEHVCHACQDNSGYVWQGSHDPSDQTSPQELVLGLLWVQPLVEDPEGVLHITSQPPGQPWTSCLVQWGVRRHWDGEEVVGSEQAMLGDAAGDYNSGEGIVVEGAAF